MQEDVADRLAGLIADRRNPLFVIRSVTGMLRARRLLIASGYDDADDLRRHIELRYGIRSLTARDVPPLSLKRYRDEITIAAW